MEDSYLKFSEIVSIQLLLGAIVYLVSSLVLFFVLKKRKMKFTKLFLLILAHFVIVFVLSVLVWKLWIFKFDIMFFEVINLPALFAEVIFLLVAQIWYSIKAKTGNPNAHL